MSIDFMIDEAEKSTKETIKALGEEDTGNGNEALKAWFTGGYDENAPPEHKPHFKKPEFFGYYYIADLGISATQKQKVAAKANSTSASDVAADLAGLSI